MRPTLSTINYNVENNLFISLSTCYGAYILKAVELLERIPFAGFIGSAYEIMVKELETDWTSYFDVLLSTKNFYEAIKSLNLSNTRVPYSFFTAEQIFDRYAKAYLAMFNTRKGRREKIKSLHRRVREIQGLKEQYTHGQLNEYFKMFVTNQSHFMEEVKDYFMLRTDKLPF